MTDLQRIIKTNGSLQDVARIKESGTGVDFNHEQDQMPKKMVWLKHTLGEINFEEGGTSQIDMGYVDYLL